MKRLSAIAGAIAFASLSTAAQAVTVELETLNLDDGVAIEANAPGFGSSGPVTLNWAPTGPTGSLFFWNATYSNRDAAYCNGGVGCLLDILVSAGSTVTFNSFRLGGFPNTDRTMAYTVTDLSNNTIVASGLPDVDGTTGLTALVGATSTSGFRLSFGPDGFNGGINDIDYSFAGISAVPEPATWAMMIMGFFLTGAALRRKRHPALLSAHA